MGEVADAYGLGAEAVGDGAADSLGAPSDDGAGAEAFGCVAGQLGFYAEDFGLRAELLDGGCDSAEQAAAADGGEDEIDFGEGLDDFKAAGGLAGDDLLVVVGRDDDVAVLADEFVGFGEALAGGYAYVDDFCAEASVAARLMAGALEGITMTAFAPTSRAA